MQVCSYGQYMWVKALDLRRQSPREDECVSQPERAVSTLRVFWLQSLTIFQYIVYCVFMLTNRKLAQLVKQMVLRHSCVGGQGFDPCLLHFIFHNICLQILCLGLQRVYHTPSKSSQWIILKSGSKSSGEKFMMHP